jgi:hypothetical protein
MTTDQSHASRLEWLTCRGFLPETRTFAIPNVGTCVWVDGHKGKRPVSLWLSVRDGVAVIHGPGSRNLTWDELQEWIEPTEQPEPARPLKGQKSLFGDHNA